MTDSSSGRRAHLRLIATRELRAEESKSYRHRNKQLSFPYPETSTVIFLLITSIGREEFSGIIEEYSPRWIFDVRTVPRLDTIATSRHSAFDLFERKKAYYVDLFGRLGIRSYRSAESNPAFWGSTVFDILKDAEQKGPYLFLFDNDALLRAADDVLRDVIAPAVGKSAQFARIGNLSASNCSSEWRR